jgi:hypothetical protein
MTILEMSRKMQPPGGIADVPMQQPMEGEGAPMGAAPFPVPGFADGGEVDANALIAKYQAMQNAVPANYGSDPTSAWMALAQFGAGLAQGKTFTEGMSMGTQAAGPYMAQAASDRNRRRDALSAFIAEEQARKEARAAEAAQRAEEIALRAAERKEDRSFQLQQATTEFERDKELYRLQDSLKDPDKEVMWMQELNRAQTQLDEMPEDDPARPALERSIRQYEQLLFPTETRADPYADARAIVIGRGGDATDMAQVGQVVEELKLKDSSKDPYADARAIVQGRGGDPNDMAQVGQVVEELKIKTTEGGALQAKNVVVFDENAPNGFRTAMANYDKANGTYFTVDPTTNKRTYFQPEEVMEGRPEDVVTVTADGVGNTTVTIKAGPRAGESYLSTFTTSDGKKLSFGSPVGIGVDKANPYAVEQAPPTVPIEKLNPQTRDDMATRLSGIEQSIRTLDNLLKTNLRTGPLSTIQGWSTKAAALAPEELSKKMQFLANERGAAHWALVQREIVRARVLSPRMAVSEQEAVREFETQVGPQEFLTNPEAAAVRLQEILRSMKNDYEYLKGSLTNKPYLQQDPIPLGTADEPFDMSDEKANAYVNSLLQDRATKEGLRGKTMFFPNFPASMGVPPDRFQKTNGPLGVGYYVKFGDLQ